MNIKQIFKVKNLEEAINEILKAKLIAGWPGCLKLETNGNEILLTQYQDCRDYQQGYTTIYQISDSQTWPNFLQGLWRKGDKLVDVCGNVYTKEQLLEKVNILQYCTPNMLYKIQAKLEYITNKMEAKI